MTLPMAGDDRPIKSVWWDDDYGSQIEVGRQGVTRIESYHEPGQMALVPWIAVYKGDYLEQRINPASLGGVVYEEPKQ
jgi:hypothetical protein